MSRVLARFGTNFASTPLNQPGFWVVLALAACATMSRSVANYAAFFLLAYALWHTWHTRGMQRTPDDVALAWLYCAGGAFAMLFVAAAFWDDRFVYSLRFGRMLPAAVAAWLLARSAAGWDSEAGRRWITHALALACVLSAGVTYFYGRDTPTNPIPWAICAAMCVAAVVPRSMDPAFSRACRIGWAVAAIFGICGVTWSLTRGAYGIWPWAALAWTAMWWSVCSTQGRRRAAMTVAALLMVTGASIAILSTSGWGARPQVVSAVSGALQKYGPVSRIEAAAHELLASIRSPDSSAAIETSVGVRIHLWRIASGAFMDSPWVGVGINGLDRRIAAEAVRLDSKALRYADDQAHNEYLQVAASYGLWGIAALLLTIGGLLLAAARSAAQDVFAAWQLVGIAFMHASGAVTNVNFSQNYYGIVFGIVVALVLLSRRRSSSSA